MRTDVELEAAFDLVFGPLLYRLIIGHAPLDEAGLTRSSTRRCADSPPVTEITRIFGTLRA
ncbi:MAG: transcriptional regulator [Mycobacterium sp.]|jgi:hypothetical protein|nr:transcriptional regulator [Mycobacterium sp.]